MLVISVILKTLFIRRLTMSITPTITVSDPLHLGGSATAILAADLKQAIGAWGGYLVGDTPLSVELDIISTAVAREDSTSTNYIVGSSNGVTLLTKTAFYAEQTGQEFNPGTPDIRIEVDPTFIRQNLDVSAAFTPTSSVAAGKYNPVLAFMHEIGHGLGMGGWYDQGGKLPDGTYMSVFDSMLSLKNGLAFFTGSHAEAVYGGPAPITSSSTLGENYSHFGNTISDINRTPATVADPLTLDLMTGVVFFFNYPYAVSSLDLAVLKDLGYSVMDPHSATDVFVYGLYEGAYGRAPDVGGFKYWTDVLDAGKVTTAGAASMFLGASEAAHNLSNAAFVSGVYEDALGRAADAGGLAYWTAALDHGQGRDAVLLAFVDSAEAVKMVGVHSGLAVLTA